MSANTVVRTNVLSLNSHRNLGLVSTQQARASARLSSGFRINSAADDAAGLGISEKMRAQIRGLDQASRNAQDGISLIQTAEGAMATINEMVIRIRELVVQASNDTNVHDPSNVAQSDRARIQDEIDQLIEEIDQTAVRTQFNTRNLIDGNLSMMPDGWVLGDIPAAVGAAAPAGATPPALAAQAWNADQRSTLQGTIHNMITSRAIQLVTEINDAGERIMIADAGDLAAARTRAGLDTANLTAIAGQATNGGGAAGSGYLWTAAQIADGTAADQLWAWVRDDLLTGPCAGVPSGGANLLDNTRPGLWFQIGANVEQGATLFIDAMHSRALGIGDGEGTPNINVMNEFGEAIQRQITVLDNALSRVTQQRSLLGAMQNRLEVTMQNLDVSSENLQAAESRIRDADMAREMMRLTQANVLQQAATAMLAQANQAPQNVLQLLR
jgi:flagellin